MGMRFDRNADGEGVQMSCHLENGRLYLEWSFRVVECAAQEVSAVREKEGAEGDVPPTKMTIHLRLTDRNGLVALECKQQLSEEESLRAILLQPRLWNGTQDPYLYQLQVFLLDWQEKCVDYVNRHVPFRIWESRESYGGMRADFFLNGESFRPRAVRYVLPEAERQIQSLAGQQVMSLDAAACGEAARHRVWEDMQCLVKLGANCVCLEGDGEADVDFLQLCDALGLVVCGKGSAIKIYNVDKIPRFWSHHDGVVSAQKDAAEATVDGLFSVETGAPTSLYYRCKAKWSPEPFVYIAPESVKRLKSGNYTVTCYSNCNRVALYTDGTLFEFQKGEGVFTFWEVPAKTPCIILSAEGEGCSQSFSVHKTFTK